MQLKVLTRKRDQFKNSVWWALTVSLWANFIFYCSELIATNSTDKQWYLNRIRGDSCKMAYIYPYKNFDPEFSESPKPFNNGCYTSLELTMVIFGIIGWGNYRYFQGKTGWPDSSFMSHRSQHEDYHWFFVISQNFDIWSASSPLKHTFLRFWFLLVFVLDLMRQIVGRRSLNIPKIVKWKHVFCNTKKKLH